MIKKVPTNCQDPLHWIKREGLEYILLKFQVSLLSKIICSAVLALTFLPLLYASSSLSAFCLYLAVASVPVVSSSEQQRNIAAHMTQANCMGSHLKPQSANALSPLEKRPRSRICS